MKIGQKDYRRLKKDKTQANETFEDRPRTEKEYLQDCENICRNFTNSNSLVIRYVRACERVKKVKLADDENQSKILERYAKFKNSPIVGVVVSFEKNSKYYIGWSCCNQKCDTFNRYKGIRLAIDRAKTIDGILKDLKTNVSPNVSKKFLKSLAKQTSLSDEQKEKIIQTISSSKIPLIPKKCHLDLNFLISRAKKKTIKKFSKN